MSAKDVTIGGMRFARRVRSSINATMFAMFRCRRCAGEFNDRVAALGHICVPSGWLVTVQHAAPLHERLNKLGEDLLQLAADLEAEARRPK